MVGCKSTDPRLHPNSNPNVVSFGNMQELTIKAPIRRTTKLDGSVVEEPIMETKTVTNPDTGIVTVTTTPMLANLNIKDQTMKAPKTWIDVVDKMVGFIPGLGFAYLAADVTKDAISSSAKDPLVVEKETTSVIAEETVMHSTGSSESSWSIINP